MRIKSQQALSKVRGSSCVVCSKPSDPAHIKSRGAGGDDIPDNLIALCRQHHSEQHQRGWVRFAEENINLLVALEAKGWVIEELFGTKKLVRGEGA